MLYLHFLDRELAESVRWSPSSIELHRLLRLATLFSGEQLYSALSALWENPAVNDHMREELLLSKDLGQLHLVSGDRTVDEFLDSRQVLYAHDSARYPRYFDERNSEPLIHVVPDWYKRSGTTAALAANLGAWAGKQAALPQTVTYTRLGPPVLKALAERDGRAVTISLFRPYLESAGVDGNGFAEAQIARLISRAYAEDYASTFDGQVVTGIPELAPYVTRMSSFPDCDVRLWSELASSLGALALINPEATPVEMWASFIAQREQPEMLEFARDVRALFRGLTKHIATRESARMGEDGDDSFVADSTVVELRRTVHVVDRVRLPADVNPVDLAKIATNTIDLIERRLMQRDPIMAASVREEREKVHEDDLVTDLLLVTVTDVETDALRRHLEEAFGNGRARFGRNLTYWDYGPAGGVRISTVRSSMGSTGVSGSTLTVAEAIQERHPSSVVGVGIAFGVDERAQPIGQLLVSASISAYDARRVGTGGDGRRVTIHRGTRTACSPRLLSTFRDARLSDIGIAVKVGEVLSGDVLIDNDDFKRELLSAYPEAIGGEMEGAGVQSAADRERVAWVVVKAVCDYAANKSDDKKARQAIAAEVAARAVAHVIASGAFTIR